ncbi:MAG: hypothetical protein U0Q22_18130 [Acidimicrobiales bacterium]
MGAPASSLDTYMTRHNVPGAGSATETAGWYRSSVPGVSAASAGGSAQIAASGATARAGEPDTTVVLVLVVVVVVEAAVVVVAVVVVLGMGLVAVVAVEHAARTSAAVAATMTRFTGWGPATRSGSGTGGAPSGARRR